MRYQARHSAPRRSRRRAVLTATGIASLLAAAASVVVLQPFPPAPARADGRQPVTATTAARATGTSEVTAPAAAVGTRVKGAGTGPARTGKASGTSASGVPDSSGPTLEHPCRPSRLVIDGLGIDAPVTEVGLARDGSLGVPSERQRSSAGWYPSVLAGAARGTVLMDGHTYRDGSAIFTTDFAQRARVGMVLRLSCDDGGVVSYRLSQLRLDLTPESYPAFVSGRRLYAADGPAQLVMVTCTGWDRLRRVWANRAVLIATPVAASVG